MQTQSQKSGLNRSSWILMLGICLLMGCSVTNKTKAVNESTAYLTVAKEKLGDEVNFAFNKDRSYVLCQTEPSPNPDNPSFRFLVFSMKDEKVVMEQSVRSGFVKWLSGMEIEIFSTPGFMRNDQSRDEFTQVYHVVTGNSIPKTDWKK